MKHVLSGHEERKPARDRTQEEKTARDGTPKPKKERKKKEGRKERRKERKSNAKSRHSWDFDCSSSGEVRFRESENPMRIVKLEKLVLPSW